MRKNPMITSSGINSAEYERIVQTRFMRLRHSQMIAWINRAHRKRMTSMSAADWLVYSYGREWAPFAYWQ